MQSPKNRPPKYFTYYKRQKYKNNPKELELGDFLTKYVEDSITKEQNQLIERALQKEYREHRKDEKPNTYAQPKKKEKFKAFLVTYVDEPELMFIGFETNKDRAKYQATKYFFTNFHPRFVSEGREAMYDKARTKRLNAFDQYADEGRAPIAELLKFGFEFPCACCGNDNFTYEDYEAGRCFIIEGEGDLNVFTKGTILCYQCYNKLNGK